MTLLNERTRISNKQLNGLRWTQIRNALVFSHSEWNQSQFNTKLTRTLEGLEQEGEIEKTIISSKNVRYRVSKTHIEKNLYEEKKGLILGFPVFKIDPSIMDPSWGSSEEDFKKFKKRHIENLIKTIYETIEIEGSRDKKFRKIYEDYLKKQSSSINKVNKRA
jgi:hypothetical protein